MDLAAELAVPADLGLSAAVVTLVAIGRIDPVASVAQVLSVSAGKVIIATSALEQVFAVLASEVIVAVVPGTAQRCRPP